MLMSDTNSYKYCVLSISIFMVIVAHGCADRWRLCCSQDYNDHINELANKLVSIMDSMFDISLSKVCARHAHHGTHADVNYVSSCVCAVRIALVCSSDLVRKFVGTVHV